MRSFDMFPDAAIKYMLKHHEKTMNNKGNYTERGRDGDLISRNHWRKLMRFNAVTPYDGSAYASNGTNYDPNADAFLGLPDDATHVMWFAK